MPKHDLNDIEHLSRVLDLDPGFLSAFLEEAAPDHVMLSRLRRVQRLCETFEIEPQIAALLIEQAEHISRLERQLRHLAG